ncbi:MAG: DUF3850 domain-containing protein [Lactococcus lactis]|nr:DUF3850 domain-containing protein [Lactococcus lactis]MDN5473936.1 DUF3850 domain-containing protein [Lactococcus lactis]
MKVHDLKLDTKFYDDVKSGKKNFEIRKNDRDYEVEDILKLHMWHSESGIEGYSKVLSFDENTKIRNITKVDMDKSDTVTKVVISIWTLGDMFNEAGYVDELESAINLDYYERILADYFESDALPEGYVLMRTEAIE